MGDTMLLQLRAIAILPNGRSLQSSASLLSIYGILCKRQFFFWLGNPISDWPYHAMFNVEAMRPFFSPQRIVGILWSRILPVFAALGMIVLRHRWRGSRDS